MRRYTSYADRQEIVTLREAGDSYRAIAQKTGWSFEVIGKICRAYQERSQEALQPKRLGRPSTGPLSSFDPLVKYACLRIKCQHARWGPDIVLFELTQRSWAQDVKLPTKPTRRRVCRAGQGIELPGWPKGIPISSPRLI
jgi:hypothetical protein